MYIYSSLSVCQTVRTLIIILCRFWVSQFIVKLYKAPLCLLILILPSPCLLIVKFWFLVLITYFDYFFAYRFVLQISDHLVLDWINNCIHPGLHLVPYLRRNKNKDTMFTFFQVKRKIKITFWIPLNFRLHGRYHELAPHLVPMDYTEEPDVTLPLALIVNMPELKVKVSLENTNVSMLLRRGKGAAVTCLCEWANNAAHTQNWVMSICAHGTIWRLCCCVMEILWIWVKSVLTVFTQSCPIFPNLEFPFVLFE